jgi:hypothetical protein
MGTVKIFSRIFSRIRGCSRTEACIVELTVLSSTRSMECRVFVVERVGMARDRGEIVVVSLGLSCVQAMVV